MLPPEYTTEARIPASDDPGMNQEQTPEVLLRRAATGDEDSFRALYRQLSGCVYRFALHMRGNAGLAEEVTQETFLVLIRDPGRYDPERATLKAFLYGVARNHTLRALEKESRFAPFSEPGEDEHGEPAGPGIAPHVADASEDLLRREQIGRVRRAVLALPSVYREAVVLCDLQELSYEEAANSLGCAAGTLRSRLHRGRELLATRLRATERTEAIAPAAFPLRPREEYS
ncbi:MAG TPA: sigma-70 family RNA polymerase sigma factor [Candidatus Acidoferrales bacterium]|nr:sigma-70 family RNA polymerase sigma factor [Candidatus Acidoferrales bacterium]